MQVNRIKSSVKGYKTLSVSVNNQKVSLLQVNRNKSSVKGYKTTKKVGLRQVNRNKSTIKV